jgi:hypothetical protein
VTRTRLPSLSALPALILAGSLVLAACGGGDGEAAETTPAPTTTAAPTTTSSTTTTTSSTTTTTEATTTTTVPEVIRMPLTGAPVEDASAIPNRPALVVKIDNHPRARPQAGLNEADIVFEENVEGALTRFAAVFHSQGSDPVGPIRSGRTQDVGMVSALNQPLFAWSGGNAGVRRFIDESDLVNLDAGFTSGYYRRSGRGGAPHNLYSSTDALWANTPPEFNVPPEIFPYLAPGEEPEGEAANVVEMQMQGIRVRWEYDPATGQYRRFQNGDPHETELTGQVTTDNLVVMGVRYQPSFVDRRSPEAQVVGTGPVYVFSGGVMRSGIWIHLDQKDPYGLLTGPGDDADPIGLRPGRTFVELAEDAADFVTWQG